MKQIFPDGLFAAFDLGAFSLKVSIVERSNARDRLAAVEEIVLKPISDFPGENEYNTYLVQVVDELSERLPIKSCRERVALVGSRDYQVKIIDLPQQVQQEQLENVLNWEAKKLLSPNVRNEPYVFGYRTIKSSPYVAIVAVMPRSLLVKAEEVFKSAGIVLTGVYGEVFAGLALGELACKSGLPALALLNVGSSSTHLSIFSGGELKFYRHVPAGVGDFPSVPKPSDMEVYSQKIRFSFDYFRAVTKLPQIDEICMMGGGVLLEAYSAYARDYFAPAKMSPVDISSKVDVSPVLSDFSGEASGWDKLKRISPFIPGIGAILSHISAPDRSHNLLGRLHAESFREKSISIARTIPLIVIFLAIAAGVISVYFERSELQLVAERERLEASTIENRLNTGKIKLARLVAAGEQSLRLSPIEKSLLEPIIKSRHLPHHLIYLIYRNRPKGLTLLESAVLPAAESERMVFETSEDEKDTVETRPVDPFELLETRADQKISMLSQADFFEKIRDQGFHEGIGGESLILFGRAENPSIVASYAARLSEVGAVKRFNVIQSRREKSGFLFFMKGEIR